MKPFRLKTFGVRLCLILSLWLAWGGGGEPVLCTEPSGQLNLEFHHGAQCLANSVAADAQSMALHRGISCASQEAPCSGDCTDVSLAAPLADQRCAGPQMPSASSTHPLPALSSPGWDRIIGARAASYASKQSFLPDLSLTRRASVVLLI